MTPLDDAAVVQAGQLGRGEAEGLGQDLVGVAAEDRRLSRLTVAAIPAQRRTAGDHGVTVAVPVPVPDGVRYETTVIDK